MQAWLAVRFSLRGRSSTRTSARLLARRDVRSSEERRGIRWNANDRQMDWQRRWAASCLLEVLARAHVHRELYRSGRLFQCRRLDLSGFPFAWGVCEKRSIRRSTMMGDLRTVALTDR